MRLDKFLKVSRIIKRRSVAKEIADQGRITVNGRAAKSSSNVALGDQLIIKFGNKTETIKINKIIETTKKMKLNRCMRFWTKAIKRTFVRELTKFNKHVTNPFKQY
jgi:Ribosome-associated heat shock protein implicated in the recycling of the 50S subunit (S4 paralog)